MDDDATAGETTGDGPVRGHIRQVGYRRVTHGLFLPVRDDPDPDAEFLRELAAWQLVLPEGAGFTHLTAARLYGWQLPNLPEQVPVFAAVSPGSERPRRPGLICSRVLRPKKATRVKGVPCEAPEEVLLRAARDLGVLDVVIMLDSALRLGHIDRRAMEALLGSSRPGVRALRAAWEQATHLADSAGETVLRLFDRAMEVDVTPQVELFDEAGNLVAKVDLHVTGTDTAHEYDGAHHRGKTQHRTDLRRERALSRAGYKRRGFTLDDLTNHPGVAMHEIDRDLGRPHDLRRLRVWRRLLEHSLYSSGGRDRVMNRWRRQMGVVDWARSA